MKKKYDEVRIKKIYEKEKWKIINEEIDCKEEEMIMLEEIKVKVKIKEGVKKKIIKRNNKSKVKEDDIDDEIEEIKVKLEG
jgi:CRISPR/Cas system CMR subunit Cmr4 (Cas7 group RAMP superfamily)